MQSYYLGIDVSKGYADFIILDASKKPIMPNFQLDDTFDGHCQLYNTLCEFSQEHPAAVIYAAVESTGGYENNWFSSLTKFQGTLTLNSTRLNPSGVNANSKAALNRIVTDKISAQNVAEYMISHPEKVSYQQEDSLASLRKQWSFVRMLTKQCTQLLNQLEALLYSANPELLVFCKNGTPRWMLKLLLRYPTAAKLAKARASSLAKIPFVSRARAQGLVATAKRSVASSTDQVTEQLIGATVAQILHLKNTIKAQTEIMAKECAVGEVALLKSFTGISDFSAIGLMLEIQTVKRFPSTKKIASFFGLHPVYKVSGDGAGGFHMSKKGRKEPRQILYMVAMSAITSNVLIREIYEEQVRKGMPRMAAIGLCMHKILRILYGMLKHNKCFNPEVDRENRKNQVMRPKKAAKDKNRRYQDYDPSAPISGRQGRKRQERKQSHSEDIAKVGISASAPAPV